MFGKLRERLQEALDPRQLRRDTKFASNAIASPVKEIQRKLNSGLGNNQYYPNGAGNIRKMLEGQKPIENLYYSMKKPIEPVKRLDYAQYVNSQADPQLRVSGVNRGAGGVPSYNTLNQANYRGYEDAPLPAVQGTRQSDLVQPGWTDDLQGGYSSRLQYSPRRVVEDPDYRIGY